MSDLMEAPVADGAVDALARLPGAVQKVQGTYATAMRVQVPRTLAHVQSQLLAEADLGGAAFFYGWGAGKDKIEGASIVLATALARCWGNCVVELQPVQELSDSWVFTAAFVDLETGFTLSRQFRQSKSWTVHGRHDEHRKADIRFQIGQSKSIRNVVLNALPRGLVDKAVERAKSGVRIRIEQAIKEGGIDGARLRIFKGLAKHGVDEPRVLKKIGVSGATAIGVDELVTLNGDLRALDDQVESPEILFPVEAGAAESKTAAMTGQAAKKEGDVPAPAEDALDALRNRAVNAAMKLDPAVLKGLVGEFAEFKEKVAKMSEPDLIETVEVVETALLDQAQKKARAKKAEA